MHATPDLIFRTTITSTDTVLRGRAAELGPVVWASSERRSACRPDAARYAPVDEEHERRPESSYALSKVLGEEMARQFHRWSGIPIVGLRFSNVIERHDYERFPGFWDDPQLRKWNLWGYVDESHVARAASAHSRPTWPAPTRSSSPPRPSSTARAAG